MQTLMSDKGLLLSNRAFIIIHAYVCYVQEDLTAQFSFTE